MNTHREIAYRLDPAAVGAGRVGDHTAPMAGEVPAHASRRHPFLS